MAAVEQKKSYHVTKDFKGLNTKANRTAIQENEFAWIENVMPIGYSNLKVIPKEKRVTYSSTSFTWGGTVHYMAPANIGGVAYMFAFFTNGGAQYVNLETPTAPVTLAASGTFSGTRTQISQWKNERILIIDTTYGYATFDGTNLVRVGSVVDVGIAVAEVGSVDYAQRIRIVALGALARLPKALTEGVLSDDFDGNQIYTILKEVLFLSWQEVPQALQWNAYDPTTQWQDAENSGLGEIDQPGNYELENRGADTIDVYSLVSALATSGLGYIGESATGQIFYADSTHRTTYLAANGYVDLTANHALASGLSIQSRAGDVRNTITLRYGNNSALEVSAVDSASVGLYGQLSQIFTTTIKHAADAQDQADFYLELRAYPRFNFNNITFELTNPEIDDSDRDNLISVFMGMPVNIAN